MMLTVKVTFPGPQVTVDGHAVVSPSGLSTCADVLRWLAQVDDKTRPHGGLSGLVAAQAAQAAERESK